MSIGGGGRAAKKMMEEVFFSSPLTIWPILKFDADYSTLEKIGQGKYGEVFRIEERAAAAGGKRARAAKVMRCARATEKLRVRDEIRMSIAAYQTLYQSSVTFGTRKQLQSEQGKAGNAFMGDFDPSDFLLNR